MNSKEQPTEALLDAARLGDPSARDRLLTMVYEQLRHAARGQMKSERAGHTLTATALVHEAFLKLAGPREIPWENRRHFYVAAAEAMRQVLVEHARGRGRLKRGGGKVAVPLGETAMLAAGDGNESGIDYVELDVALRTLEATDAQMAEVVQLRFFAGLTEVEAALVLGVSDRTVRTRWGFAKAWLSKELRGKGQA